MNASVEVRVEVRKDGPRNRPWRVMVLDHDRAAWIELCACASEGDARLLAHLWREEWLTRQVWSAKGAAP